MMRILVVCTANICRSPMAAGLLRAAAPAAGLDARVASAGILPGGRPADPNAVAVMAARGIDISGHRSRQLATADLDVADLVLAMAQEHIVEIGAQRADALPKSFTVKELVRLAEPIGPKPAGLDLAAYLGPLDSVDRRQRVLRRDPDDDVADPFGMGKRAFQRTAEELDGLVRNVVGLLAGGIERPAS